MKIFALAALLLCSAAAWQASARGKAAAESDEALKPDFRLSLYDAARERVVPVAVYAPPRETSRTKVLIFSHGYGKNRSLDNCVRNGWLTRRMANEGYYVISIQHELPTDPLVPMGDDVDIYEARLPNWRRGCGNIMFVVETFRAMKPSLDWANMVLVGHSMGGDTSVMFATEHPEMVSKVITLDNCRVKIPRTSWPRFYTLRACNTTPSPGVVPTDEECRIYGITAERMEGIRHSDMGSRGLNVAHKRVAARVCDFLRRSDVCEACRAWRRSGK